MAGALRLVSVQRGHDPRDFALVAYGGAGPLHANAVAELMGSFPVIVPPAPGLLCAIGDLVADFRDEFAQTYIRLLADAAPEEVARILDDLGARADTWLDSEGIPDDTRTVTYTADMGSPEASVYLANAWVAAAAAVAGEIVHPEAVA